MSWLTDFSEKAESILNTIDKNAAIAFNKQVNSKNKSAGIIPETSSVINLEEGGSLTNQLDFNYPPLSENPSSLDSSVSVLDFKSGLSTTSRDKGNEFLQNEMLQNEIHSLNNEISLLLNRVKISEQNTSDLNEKLSALENKNSLLEEQISKLISEKYSAEELKEICKNLDSSDHILSKVLPKLERKNSNIHEHYDAQIQELFQQNAGLEEALRSKEDEIIMLKSRLSQKTYCFSADELQSRLRALTITLVQKQSSLDSLASEKNALTLKYNQLQKRHDEVLGILHQSRMNMNDTDDVKAKVPVYKFERGLLSRLKKFASPIDSLGIKMEMLIRKSSFSRLLFLFYLIIMHVIVFLLIYSHMPESSSR